MDDHSLSNRCPNRRTFLTTSAALGIGAVLGSGSAGLAWGAPGSAAKCGKQSDSGPQHRLWDAVKDLTDTSPPGSNEVVVKPASQPDPKRTQYYAVRHGGDVPKHPDIDWLVVPTNRIKGIECSYLVEATMQNLWLHAWDQAQARLHPASGSAIVLGVNSVDKRSEDQVHLHLTDVYPPALKGLRAAKVQSGFHNWMTAPTVELDCNDRDKKVKNPIRRHFRVVKHDGTLPNLFQTLDEQLKKHAPLEKMDDQMIAVVAAAGTANSFYVLNSTGGLPGGGTGSTDILFDWPKK